MQCKSTTGVCYYLSKEFFIHCVNQFKFPDRVVEEQVLMHQIYCDRMAQTHEFHQKFNKHQKDILNRRMALDKVREEDEERKQYENMLRMNLQS